MSDAEKSKTADVMSNSEIEQIVDPDAGLSEAERAEIERKLLRKLDITIIPWVRILCLLYLLCFLDRTNIGNAKIASLETDVPMTDSQYNATLTIFFISYSIFEALANFLLKKWRPSIFIPVIMILWGICMLSMGFVKNWSGLMAARWFLGVAEAGMFPGVNYYLSCWYKRNEFGSRAALFFSAAALAGSFGGLLAAAIQKLDGKAGLAGWAWIFVIEGGITIVLGFMSFWMVHDFPDEAKFLSKDDRARVLYRLKQDKQSSAEHESFKMEYLWAAVKDWKMYVGMLVYMGPLMPLYSFSLFLPSIIQGMSFTSKDDIIKNQLLSVAPYAAAAIATVVVGLWSDRARKRAMFNIVCAWVGIMGFVMLMASNNPGVQYAGTFFGAMGIYPSISLTIAWIANNVEGVYKRGILLGFVIGWGNLNGVVSSNIYFHKPRYLEGHGAIVGYLFVCMFGGSVLMATLLSRENKKRLNGERDYLAEGKTEKELEAMGDNRPDFLYTI
ncbi:putative transporter [Escovopsis weberi]|uniref:Putative transporter n=1 Tax=Escovopsis weberi TaxID=150374 RepID=A0A0M9VXJ5_ESCWE|nr:putative transporter [Escovopsis weberi]